MTFYSIKHLLTKGIEEFEGDVWRSGPLAPEYASGENSDFPRFERLGLFAFTDRPSAVAAARKGLEAELAKIDNDAEKKRRKLQAILARLEGEKS